MSTEVEIGNKNQALIDALRMLATFLETKPEMPTLRGYGNGLYLTNYVHSKDDLKEFARHLGTFEKKFTDHNFELVKTIEPSVLTFEICISRELVCKKIVTWDCPDDEALLKLVDAAVAE